ncbi:hypothetical protein BVH62_19775 [Vibrio cholerae]|nr:hypothetical protein [Vibrio cholerae]
MVTAVVFEFSGMRCQPLRRALCVFIEEYLWIKNPKKKLKKPLIMKIMSGERLEVLLKRLMLPREMFKNISTLMAIR